MGAEGSGPGGALRRGGATRRPEAVEPFVRGCAWPAGAGVTYPRADPADFGRLPIDTWATAQVPVTVRLEWVGDAAEVEIDYWTDSDDLGYRGAGAGQTFELWRAGAPVDEQPAKRGPATARLRCGHSEDRCVVYLPEGMKPTVTALRAAGGEIEPAPPRPRWLAYGDSVAEGWCASRPSGAWPAIVARDQRLDVCNLGYAGSARGEIVSAEHLARVPADVISVTHGTNCWTRVPFSAAMMHAGTAAFLDVVRQGHPETPIVVVSPIVRPDAEATPNRLGATLADLRSAMERAAMERVEGGDRRLWLVPGAGLIGPDRLGDGIHPDDDGHRQLAVAIGDRLGEVAWSS